MFLSVALCTFNGEKYISSQLKSILDQSQQVDEIIICDDNSNDKTRRILKDFQQNYPNIIKQYINESSLGTISNFEKAIKLCSGELIFLSDQDDVWKRDKVEKTIAFFKNNPECKLSFSNGALVDKNDVDLKYTLWEKWGFSEEKQQLWRSNIIAFQDLLKNNNKITGATICMHRDLKTKVIPIRVPIGYWHDAWLGIHASANDSLFFIDDCLIKYRIHENQQVGVSNKVDRLIIEKSNKDSVSINTFFKNLRRMYPEHKKYIKKAEGNKSLKSRLKSLIQQIGK